MAFLALGRFSSRTRMLPDPGAGTCCVLITASSVVDVLYLETKEIRRDDVGYLGSAEVRRIRRGGILYSVYTGNQ